MRVASLAEYHARVAQIVRKWTPAGVDWYVQPWFRGHGNAAWALEPGWNRLPHGGRGTGAAYYRESQLLANFKLRAPNYLERLPSSDWEWLFLMQHYGLPTRLLDWTESSLVALYFALRDNAGAHDAAVWVLSPWWLNRVTFGRYVLFAADDPRARGHAPLAPGRRLQGRLPLAITAVRSSPRIAAQHGVFTIHGRERGALDRLARGKGRNPPCLLRLLIPRQGIADLRQELAVAGISESAVFPELSGLCRELRMEFFAE